MPLKIQSDTLRQEVQQIRKILRSVAARIEQIPGEDIPAGNDWDIEIFEVQMRGELMLAAERLTALVEVLE
jgi:hypothetical protein